MYKRNVVYPYNGILVSNLKYQTTDACDSIDEAQTFAKWKKPNTKTTYCVTHL